MIATTCEYIDLRFWKTSSLLKETYKYYYAKGQGEKSFARPDAINECKTQ